MIHFDLQVQNLLKILFHAKAHNHLNVIEKRLLDQSRK